MNAPDTAPTGISVPVLKIDGPRKASQSMRCTEPGCDWTPEDPTTQEVRDHVVDRGHIVEHDIVLATTFIPVRS